MHGWRKPLYDGLDGPDLTNALYYKRNIEQSAGTPVFQEAVKRNGRGTLKLSIKEVVRPPAHNQSDRAEVWENDSLRAPHGQGMWYGFAVKFADPIPADDHRYVIAQWKREIVPGADGNFSPFLAIRLQNGKLYATIETNYVEPVDAGTPGAIPAYLRPEANQVRGLIATDSTWRREDARLFTGFTDVVTVTNHGNPLPRPSSGWIDFVVYTKPDPGGAGHIEIIANGKPIVTVKGRIGLADEGLGERQYFKFGPYRARRSGDWTLYYADFRRSPHRADVTGEVDAGVAAES